MSAPQGPYVCRSRHLHPDLTDLEACVRSSRSTPPGEVATADAWWASLTDAERVKVHKGDTGMVADLLAKAHTPIHDRLAQLVAQHDA